MRKFYLMVSPNPPEIYPLTRLTINIKLLFYLLVFLLSGCPDASKDHLSGSWTRYTNSQTPRNWPNLFSEPIVDDTIIHMGFFKLYFLWYIIYTWLPCDGCLLNKQGIPCASEVFIHFLYCN